MPIVGEVWPIDFDLKKIEEYEDDIDKMIKFIDEQDSDSPEIEYLFAIRNSLVELMSRREWQMNWLNQIGVNIGYYAEAPTRMIPGQEWSENWRAFPHCNTQGGCWMHAEKPHCNCDCRWCKLARLLRENVAIVYTRPFWYAFKWLAWGARQKVRPDKHA